VAVAVYLAAALALVVYFRFYWYWIPRAWTANHNEIASLVGAGLLLASSISVFIGRRFGDLTALVGALCAWSGFWLIVFNRYGFSPWVIFNMPGSGPELHSEFLMAALTILATSTLVAATACSALRLTPRIWVIGKVPLRDRAWPGLAIALLFVVVWYVKTVSPYQIPIFDIHQARPTISVLHVEKHGLHFSETNLAVYRDGQFYLARDDRSLFRYSFERGLASGDITGDCVLLFNRLAKSPPEFSGSHVSSYVPPHAWNADRWYIYIGESAGRKPMSVDAAVVPDDVLRLFYLSQKLPQERAEQETARDVCLGICYDPDAYSLPPTFSTRQTIQKLVVLLCRPKNV
jgi:hypothetical protein